MADTIDKLVLNSAVIDVYTQNPGLDLTIADASRVVLVNAGCIRSMRYGSSSSDLTYVQFDNSTLSGAALKDDLKRFRETFECAAKFGMGVTYCLSKDGKTVSMVNLYPCRCKCNKD